MSKLPTVILLLKLRKPNQRFVFLKFTLINYSRLGSNMATHTPVGVGAHDDPPAQIRRGAPCESTSMFIFFQREDDILPYELVHCHLGSNMATHTPVGVGAHDDPPAQIRRAHLVSPHLCLYFFNGRMISSPTDTNCFNTKMATHTP